MSASSSMLAATPPATPRSVAQPSPFDFPSQDSEQYKFRSLASFDAVQQAQGTRDFGVNRSFDNVSPRPYLGIEGASNYPLRKSWCSFPIRCVINPKLNVFYVFL
ncbi:hypothetical protein KR018_012398 [Drosophila ironensis]|nr:hypothetical protein KR018_012398 [Drosophila ironensis]